MSTKRSKKNLKRRSKQRTNSSKSASAANSLAFKLPKPAAVQGEPLEDQALFDPDVLSQLAEPLQEQARLIIAALDGTHRGDLENASSRLRDIPRASPYADWRLFVRGLVAWYLDDFQLAGQAWAKLEPGRRAARIAAVLSASISSAAAPSGNVSPVELASKSNAAVEHTNEPMVSLVEKLRGTRPALGLARRIAKVRHRSPDVTFSASQVALLLELRQNYLEIEPELVEQMTQACVQLARQQPDIDTFKLLVYRLPGPDYDPAWSYTLASFLGEFEGADQQRADLLVKYAKSDLPNNSRLDPTLRSALISVVYENVGEQLINDGIDQGALKSYLKVARVMYDNAAIAYPANRAAYLGLLDCIEREVEAQPWGREPTKEDRREADDQAQQVYTRWLEALPEDVAPRLWLIDHYLENDQPFTASKLASELPISSLGNFRVKMLPWKIKLAEAMAAAQKKRSIPQAEIALAEAISLWPNWLSRDFVPFLNAAFRMRCGDDRAFESIEIQLLLQSGLPVLLADIMKLASAQMMSVEPAKLKKLREAVEQHVKVVEQLSTEDLARLGSFYWDLKFCGLSYPAWRMHGSKFGMELCDRLESPSQPDIPGLIQSCLWMAEARFFGNSSYDDSIPGWLKYRSLTDPLVAAAILRSRRLRSFAWRRIENRSGDLPLVEQALKTESRPVERLIMEEAVQRCHDIFEERDKMRSSDPFAGFFGSRRPNFLGSMDDDEMEDDEDFYLDELDEDEEELCMCPECVAHRAELGYEDDEYEDDDDEDEYFQDDDASAWESLQDQNDSIAVGFRVILEKIGERTFEQISDLISRGEAQGRNVMPEVLELLRGRGVTAEEFLSMMNFGQRMAADDEPPPPPPKSADERRREDKQRKKMLDKFRKGK